MVEIQEILELTVAERILVMEKIWDSIDHSDLQTPIAHQQELDRRLARYERGETKFFSWSDIKAELKTTK